MDNAVDIPDYILEAVAFAGQETITAKILCKMVEHAVCGWEDEEMESMIKTAYTIDDKKNCIKRFMCNTEWEDDVVYRFINMFKRLKEK